MQIALVVDDQGRLLGTVTDGDIRRAILRGISLDESTDKIMNAKPIHAKMGEDAEEILNIMRRTNLRRIPVLDCDDVVMDLALLDDLIQPRHMENRVVLMVGGLGSRLRPLTEHIPKPLLKIGNKPLLETIIENFRGQGFRHFILSVNYKGEMIKEHFRDGSDWDVEIEYIEETKRMGTAGSLSLLSARPDKPIVVMNGDLLTKVNFHHLLSFHQEHKAKATMCVREYDFEVPYGVVKLDDHRIVGLEEKPVHSFFVNAGIYVLEPDVLDHIEKGEFFDMTTLFQRLVAEGQETTVFPIREYWMDIGRIDDFEQAKAEFSGIFTND